MVAHAVASRDEWLSQRTALLEKEKTFTRLRDELSEARRALPWTKIDKNYLFDSGSGKVSLGDLFAGRNQLIVYHFMFRPDWTSGCKSCSFWADNFNSIIVHLNQRDVSMVAISRAPLEKLETFKQRMGWTFRWVSSFGGDFNYDFGVSFAPGGSQDGEKNYNYGSQRFGGEEAPGVSVFVKGDDGAIYHSYSAYARGLDIFNTAYHYLDIVPKGRDEQALSYGMEWVRLRDEYPR